MCWHRPPKEYRDTPVTMALQAGADPYYVAAQHGHSLQTMMKDYAAFIPKGDRGTNLAAINAAQGMLGVNRISKKGRSSAALATNPHR